MNNAVIYARYSCSSQTEQSIEGQLRDCHSFADREGLTVIGEYIDRALTGRSDDRPQFQKMIADAAKRQFQYVIVYKLDRFSRNRYDSAIYKHKLKQYGVKVLSAMENIGDNPEGIILEAVLEASAEYYSRDLSQKVLRGMRESAMKGTSTGGATPFGYRRVNKNPVIDEEKAEIVRSVFRMYAEGTSVTDIVKWINSKGVTNTKGGPCSISTINSMVSNTKYYGLSSWNGIETYSWPPIIDKELFDRVQDRRALRKRAKKSPKAIVEYYLRGKAYCGYCGDKMVGESGRSAGGAVYNYYACATKKKSHKCKKKNERKDFIECYVVEQTILYVLDPARIEYIAERIVAEYDKEFNDDRIQELEKRIAKIDREIQKNVDIVVDMPKSARKAIYDKLESLDFQRDDLSADLAKLKIANDIRIKKEDIIVWLKQFCKGDLMDEPFRKKIIDVFINSIYLYDDKVVVYYNIKGGQQSSYIGDIEKTQEMVESFDVVDNVRIEQAMAHQEQKRAGTHCVPALFPPTCRWRMSRIGAMRNKIAGDAAVIYLGHGRVILPR